MSGMYRDIKNENAHNKLETAISSALTADVTAILRDGIVSDSPEAIDKNCSQDDQQDRNRAPSTHHDRRRRGCSQPSTCL